MNACDCQRVKESYEVSLHILKQLSTPSCAAYLCFLAVRHVPQVLLVQSSPSHHGHLVGLHCQAVHVDPEVPPYRARLCYPAVLGVLVDLVDQVLLVVQESRVCQHHLLNNMHKFVHFFMKHFALLKIKEIRQTLPKVIFYLESQMVRSLPADPGLLAVLVVPSVPVCLLPR